jgi:hypothetical protein
MRSGWQILGEAFLNSLRLHSESSTPANDLTMAKSLAQQTKPSFP